MSSNSSSFLSKIDFCGQTITLEHNKSNIFKTKQGGVMSFCIVLTFIIITFIFGKEIYQRSKPNINSSTTKLETSDIKLDGQPFLFSLLLNNTNVKDLSQFLTISATLEYTNKNGETNYTYNYLPVSICDITKYKYYEKNSSADRTYYCPEFSNTIISNEINDLNSTNLSFLIEKCDSKEKNNNCYTNIDQEFNNLQLYLTVVNNYLNSLSYDNFLVQKEYTQMISLSNSILKEIEIEMSNNSFTTDNDWLFDSPEVYNYISIDKFKFQSSSIRIENQKKAYISLSSMTTVSNVKRDYLKLTDVIAKIGGIINVIYILCQFLFSGVFRFEYLKHVFLSLNEIQQMKIINKSFKQERKNTSGFFKDGSNRIVNQYEFNDLSLNRKNQRNESSHFQLSINRNKENDEFFNQVHNDNKELDCIDNIKNINKDVNILQNEEICLNKNFNTNNNLLYIKEINNKSSNNDKINCLSRSNKEINHYAIYRSNNSSIIYDDIIKPAVKSSTVNNIKSNNIGDNKSNYDNKACILPLSNNSGILDKLSSLKSFLEESKNNIEKNTKIIQKNIDKNNFSNPVNNQNNDNLYKIKYTNNSPIIPIKNTNIKMSDKTIPVSSFVNKNYIDNDFSYSNMNLVGVNNYKNYNSYVCNNGNINMNNNIKEIEGIAKKSNDMNKLNNKFSNFSVSIQEISYSSYICSILCCNKLKKDVINKSLGVAADSLNINMFLYFILDIIN